MKPGAIRTCHADALPFGLGPGALVAHVVRVTGRSRSVRCSGACGRPRSMRTPSITRSTRPSRGDGFARHYQEVSPADQPPFDGAAEVCQLIRSGGGLNLIVTHRRRAGLDRLLTTHQMADLFTDVISHDDRYPRKPDPGAFLTLIERYRLPRDESLAVGDRDIDILAAHADGLSAARFGTGSITTEPDVVLPDFGTLRRLIETGWTPEG